MAPVTSSDTIRSESHPTPRPRAGRMPAGRAASRLLTGGMLSLGLLLGGCSVFEAPPIQRGNRADPEVLSQLTPGVQTQADVQALLGSPTATGTFDRDSWYYISSVTRIRPASHPTVQDQRVVVIDFDERGVIKQIRQVGEDDMKNVGMVSRTTPVPGTERTLMQSLLGNIGRVGTGGLTQDQGPGTGPGTGR
jgi:outer membrane protein assembly factor BamE (lipoprotein component of BamABCDE complex)